MAGKRGIRWVWACLAVAGLACRAAADEGDGKGGLHLPKGREINFTTYLTDGAGYRWDLQYYLNIGQGSNYLYSGGLYCQISGTNVSSNGQGWMNQAGDEVQIGPWNHGNCQIFRRCKVYRDAGLARWLDIFVNTTSAPQTLPVRIYTNTNGSMSISATSTGGQSFGSKDWAFITEHQGRGHLLHVVCGPGMKQRPDVQIGGNSLYVGYSLTVPPNGTAVLCYFESQGRSQQELVDRMKALRPAKLLADLSPAVRKLIVNFRRPSAFDEVELERSGTADMVCLKNGDAILGAIQNDSYTLEAFYGSIALPAKDVIGFVAVPGQEELVRAVLAGGQVVTGRLASEILTLALPTGGTLKIPFARLKQCAYRLSKARPPDSPMTDPLILLRTGDRLAFDRGDLKCTLQTRHGPVALAGKDLLEIQLQHAEHGVHRAVFLNGSTLAGLLEPERISLPLKLGARLDISRDLVLAIQFAADTAEPAGLASAVLTNEDELFGRLADESFAVATDFGTVPVKPANVVKMAFSRSEPAHVAVTLWDGSTIRGRIRQDTLKFAIQPGPVIQLHIEQIDSLRCPDALPPDDIVKTVERLVARLSASNYKDREEAQQELVRMGAAIAPLLRKHAQDNDPEVRQRVGAILERLTGAATAPPPANEGGVMPQGIIWRGG